MCNRLTNFTASKHCSLNSRDVDKLKVPIFFTKMDEATEKAHFNMAEVMDQDDPIVRLLFVDRINQLPMEIFVKILNYLPLEIVVNDCPEVCATGSQKLLLQNRFAESLTNLSSDILSCSTVYFRFSVLQK